MGYNLLINGVYWGYNPLTNHLLTSLDIQVVRTTPERIAHLLAVYVKKNGHILALSLTKHYKVKDPA